MVTSERKSVGWGPPGPSSQRKGDFFAPEGERAGIRDTGFPPLRWPESLQPGPKK